MHVLYFRLCLVWLYHIFAHYLIIGTNFEIKVLNVKCMFGLSPQILSETFVILKIIELDMIKNVLQSSCKVPVDFFLDFNEN